MGGKKGTTKQDSLFREKKKIEAEGEGIKKKSCLGGP